MVHMVEHTVRGDDAEMGEGEASLVPHASCHPVPGATMAVHPELIRLKCANHHPEGNPGYNALQTE
jgi:hypothetical protein